MLIANATARDSLPNQSGRRATPSDRLPFFARVRLALAWVGLAGRVWRERRALSRLSDTQRRDIGLHEHAITRELDRSVFDLPRARVAALHRAEHRRCAMR